jgi:hypothetical protein
LKKVLFLSLVFFCLHGSAQPIYVASASKITFFAGTPVEDIDATNIKALSFLNTATGDITISIPNKEFHFKRSLMEEHFNENYMESDKFPKSEFKGKIIDVQKYDFTAAANYQVSIIGVLTVHGVAKPRTLEVTVTTGEGKVKGETKFKVALSDHAIERPKILWEKIAESVDITAIFTYEPYKK